MAMIEAYKIGIEMVIAGDAITKMRQFTKVMNEATRANDKFTKSLVRLNEAFATTDNVMDSVIPKVDAFGASLNESLRAANAEMGSLNRKMGASSFMGGGRGFGGFGGGRGAGRGFHGGGLGHHMGRDLGGRYGGIGGGMAISRFGGPLAIGAMGAGMAVMGGYHADTQMQAATAQLQAQGFSPSQNAAMIGSAMSANIPGISRIDMLKATSDAAVVTKNSTSAIALAPTVAKMLFADKVLFGQLGQTFSQADERRMLQASEIRMGSTDPKVIASSLNLFQRALTAEGGPARLPTTELTGFMRRAQTAGHALSDTGMVRIIPAIQAMKGSQVGRQVRGFESGLLGGTLSKKKRAEWERLGILKKGSIKENVLGQAIGVSKDTLSSSDKSLLTSDPIKFMQQRLGPAMVAAGFVTPAQQAQELYRLEPQAYTGLPAWALANTTKTGAMVSRFGSASGVEGSFTKALAINSGNVKVMEKSLKDLATSFGALTSPFVNLQVRHLTELFKAMTSVFDFISNKKPTALYNSHLGLGILGGHKSLFDTGSHNHTTSLLGGIKTSKPVPVKSSSSPAHIFMDGRKVGEILQKHEMTAAGFPPSHGSDIDFRQTLVPTQLNAVR